MEITRLPAAQVGSWSYARNVDMERAQELAESIREIGLLAPIIVVKSTDIRNGRSVENWDVVAGRHRLKAMTSILNWTEIPCVITDASGLKAELMTIDENLRRRVLSDAERAFQTSRRKEIYEALHPETKQGGAPGASGGGKQKREGGQIGHSRFTAATAQATGRGERTIRREAERGEKLGPDLNRIAGTSLDKGVEIDALAALPPEQREDLVARAEQGEKVSARKPVTAKLVALDTEDMKAKTAGRRVMRLYLELTPRARAVFDGLYLETREPSASEG